LVFLLLFLLLIILGVESLNSLSYVNDASAQIRVRWLPSTRALGDLNNYTTDFPAADTALSRAENSSERAAIWRQMADLERRIDDAERAYRDIPHDGVDEALFDRFDAQWRAYRSIVPENDRMARGSPNAAYESASETLAALTARNEASARRAGEGSDLAYRRACRRIAVMILIAGILVAGAMLHVNRSISAPLVDLAERMHRLAASQTNIEIQGAQRHDEIGEMARAVLVFRDNAVDLAQNRQALAQQAAVLQEKLAAEQRLTLLQRNFVSMASHEFRTPLAIIDGHAQRMMSMRHRLSAAALAGRALKVRNAVRRMTQLIDNLLGSARLIDGKIELHYHPVPVDLAAILREASQVQQDLTPDATIIEFLDDRPLIVRGDAGLLSQVFGNLLSNAVKYSREGIPIRITSAASDAEIAVVIEDRGIGIPESDRQHVFERYYRGSNTSGIVGSGVGLYLAKTIVDLHRGSIAVESFEGQGSSFTLRFPLLVAGVSDSPRGPRQLELMHENPGALVS
jgi:signal transduction histidine kinase